MGKTDAEDVPGISLNDKHQKLFTRGREQHDLRPKVALLAAASSTNGGRESMTCLASWGDMVAALSRHFTAKAEPALNHLIWVSL